MKHPIEFLFYLAFASQIYLLSWAIPQRIVARKRKVLEQYPPSVYPKLYVKPAAQYGKDNRIYLLLNRAIAWIGVVIFLCLIFVVDHGSFAEDGYVSEAWPAAYGMLQFAPFLLLEISGFREFRAMRDADQSTRRQAELKPRRLFDFVSPFQFFAAAVLYVVTIIAVLAVDHGDNDGIILAVSLTLANLLFVAIGWWNLRGRNLNPHQANKDRSHQIRLTLTSFVFISVVMSVFYLITLADGIYDLDFMDAFLLSVYFQVVALGSTGYMLHCMKLEDIDFDVYKDDAVAS